MNDRSEWGFTLIELLIALVVVAILAGIAYPSYQDSIRKAQRTEAKTVLLEAAQWLERFYTENGRYDRNRSGEGVALPLTLRGSPREGDAKHYTVSLATVSATGFSLRAVPIGRQQQDPCGTLTFDHQGTKGVINTTGYTGEQCW